MKKILAAMTLIIVFLLVLTSCSNETADYTDDGIANIDFYGNDGLDDSCLYGSFIYPDNPAEELRGYLENDIKEHGLLLEVGDIERIDNGWSERVEFMIYFVRSRENTCVVSFDIKNNYHDYSLDGHDNPSFTIAFKDPDNSEDMITVLTSVIKYISPELSLEEAKELAVNQDETISIDGYSMPQDIGGYQIQTRYTNPHVFVHTREFDAKLGVRITALKQIWGELNPLECQELRTPEDYHVLTPEYTSWEADYQTKIVYADFIVKDVWQHEDWVHGDVWEGRIWQ